MIYLANPCGPNVETAMRAGRIGLFINASRAQGGERELLEEGVVWAADHGGFGGKYVGDDAYLALLSTQPNKHRCLFATAPDVVGDAAATRVLSLSMLPAIRALGYPAAFVAQNGLTSDETPWAEFDVLFLGGAPECRSCSYVRPISETSRRHCPTCPRRLTEWKLSYPARQLVADARRRGLPVHMGRVNSQRRLRYADHIGCDSADGTFLTVAPLKNLPRMERWLVGVVDQGKLWEVSDG